MKAPALSPLFILHSVHHSADHTDNMLPTLCALLPALTWVSSQKVLTQSPSVLTDQGRTVSLDCNIVKDHSYYVSCTVVFGQGTKLIVTDSAVPAPILTIFPPSSEELKSNKAILVCLANDVSSGFANVRWLVDGQAVSSGVTTGSAAQQPNKKFRLSSYLTIERSEWDKDKAITCEVSAASKATTKEIKKSECSD
ncbi:hypothetical protein SRHO_G00199030 [Serrasalmus rhombeus]